jgi:hypothetical protein
MVSALQQKLNTLDTSETKDNTLVPAVDNTAVLHRMGDQN